MRVIEFFHEVSLPLEVVWQPIADVGRWPTFDRCLTEVHTEGYEPSYVTFTPNFYLWRRMRLELFPDEGKLAFIGRLPATRVRTAFTVRRSRAGTLVHCRIRFSGWLSFLWAAFLMLPYRHRIQDFVTQWLAEAKRLDVSEPNESDLSKPSINLRMDTAHPIEPPMLQPVHELAQPD